MDVKTKMITDFKKSFIKGVKYTFTKDLAESTKKEIYENLEEILYNVVSYRVSEPSKSLKEDNGLVFAQVDISLYLQFRGDKNPSPLFLGDNYGTNYLMEEGTNAVVLAYRYHDLCELLNIDMENSVEKDVIHIFNNLLVPMIENLRNVSMTMDEFIINDIKNKTITKVEKTPEEKLRNLKLEIQKVIADGFWNNMKSEFKTIQQIVLKEADSTNVFKIDVSDYGFHLEPLPTEDKTDSYQINIHYLTETKKVISEGSKTVDSSDVMFGSNEYGVVSDIGEITRDERLLLNTFIEKTIVAMLEAKENRVQTQEIEVNGKKEEIVVHFVTPKLRKQSNVLGSPEEFKPLFENIVEYCKQGTFIKNKQDSAKYKSFFSIHSVTTTSISIAYSRNEPEKYINLFIGANGVYISEVGSAIQNYFDKMSLDLDSLKYTKKGNGLSLDDFIKIMNGIAPKVIWEGLLGFLDGRTTLNSAIVKTENLQSETPEVANIRKKYNLPKEVSIIPNSEIIGVFHGIPELKGSTDMFICMFGLNGGNPIFVSKQEVLENSDKYVKHGFKSK